MLCDWTLFDEHLPVCHLCLAWKKEEMAQEFQSKNQSDFIGSSLQRNVFIYFIFWKKFY